MARYRLALLAAVFGLVGLAAGCGKPAAAGPDNNDEPWDVLVGRDWQVVAGSYGTTPYRAEDLKVWKWTFAGMMRKVDMTWEGSPTKDFPSRKPFTTPVYFHDAQQAPGLWEIDLAESPFKGGQGKVGVCSLRRDGASWVFKVRISTDDARFGPPDSVEGQKDGYVTLELRSPAP
jgi:hypothetical protein